MTISLNVLVLLIFLILLSLAYLSYELLKLKERFHEIDKKIAVIEAKTSK